MIMVQQQKKVLTFTKVYSWYVKNDEESEHVVQIILLEEHSKMFADFYFNKFVQLFSHAIAFRNRKQKKNEIQIVHILGGHTISRKSENKQALFIQSDI